MKFFRLKNLSVEVRQEIAMLAFLGKGLYGEITRLGIIYSISRTFVYQLLWALEAALATEFDNKFLFPLPISVPEKISVDGVILLLRLEGNCSIGSISGILKVLDFENSSVGYISQRLKYYGSKLSNTIGSASLQFVIFLSDELFANSQPILITLEPKSMTILRIELSENRSAVSWKDHWIELEKNNFYTMGLVSDRGKGLVDGFKELFPDKDYYPDIFHDIRDMAKIILVKLEVAAYKAIAYEYERQQVLESARSNNVKDRRTKDYEDAKEASKKAVELYESAYYLFCCIQEVLELIDQQGNFRNAQKVRQEIETALDLLQGLNHSELKEAVETFKNNLDSILRYFEKAEEVEKELSQTIADEEARHALFLAWQWDHKSHQAKSAKQKHYCENQRDFYLEYAQIILQEKYEKIKEKAFSALDDIVRSSSLIECVNSIIRPYLDTCKGNITQEALNLIMFYHNHRQFKDGRRKGKAPLEILTGKELKEHWLDTLLAA